MLKRLLVAAIALSFIFALCNTAFAAKDQTTIKRLYQTIPNAPKGSEDLMSALPPSNPTGVKTVGDATPCEPGMNTPSHKASVCTWYDYTCGLAYYWRIPDPYGDDFFNMRFTAAEICTLHTIDMLMYDNYAEFSDVSGLGIDVMVWDDDGFGYPNAVVQVINVPSASMVYNPTYLSLDVEALQIVFGDCVNPVDYHVGYTPVDQVNDSYAILSDDGSCGTMRSSELWSGLWGLMVDDWGVDINFHIAVEQCCYCPSGGVVVCEYLDYTCGVAYYWSIPDAYGDDFFNMRFTPSADPVQLVLAELALYNNYAEFSNVSGLGINVYVWDDDGLGYPGAVVDSYNVPGASLVFYPSLISLDLSGEGLYFSDDYHIGYSPVDQVQDNIATLSDDGSCGTMRSSENWSGLWGLMLDDWGVDVNFLMFAEQCWEEDPDQPVCYNINYAGAAYYYWTIPDAYGDDFFNMRMSALPACTLYNLNIAFYQAGSVGSPGASVYLWNSDGTFPSTVYASFPMAINPVTVWYPGFETIDVHAMAIVPFGDFHLGYTPIYNDPSDVLACMSDDGSNPVGRSSENWMGIWGLMVNDWGVDVNFLMNADVCCPPAGACIVECDPDDQWPTFAHDFARTSMSGLTLGGDCGYAKLPISNVWAYTGSGDTGANINFTSPIVANDIVFVSYDDGLHAINLLTGLKIWNTNSHPDYGPMIMGTSNRCAPTYDVASDRVYFGNGNNQGFNCAEASTGTLIWSRSAMNGTDLPGTGGNLRYAPSVILGDEIYFGNEAGQIFALNKNTGVDLYTAALDYGVFGSPSYANVEIGSTPTDMLFFGTSLGTSGGAGGVYGIEPTGAAFNEIWHYVSPFQSIVNEGYTSAPTYRCDNLFINSNCAPLAPYGYWSGIRENLEPATGAELWPDHYFMGAAYNAPPAVDDKTVVFANWIPTSAGNIYGQAVRGVNFTNSTQWLNYGWGFGVPVHATLTCDPYVFFGTYNFDGTGNWNTLDGTTGELLISYKFSGVVFGTALARGSDDDYYIVVAVRSTAKAAGGIFAFKDTGDRARMVIPEHVVTLDGTSTGETPPTSNPIFRTDEDAVCNYGCLTLTFDANIEGGIPPLSKSITNINPFIVNSAENMARNLVDYDINDVAARAYNSANKMYANAFELNSDDILVSRLPIKAAKANSSALAPSTWAFFLGGASSLIGVNVTEAEVCTDFDFEFDRTNMLLLADNTFYVEVGNSNDLDYLPEYSPQPTVQDVIEYHIEYAYCAFDDGVMAFGNTGEEWYNNKAKFGDGDVALDFTLDGSDDHLYEGTMFFMTSMDDAAWNVFSADASAPGFLFPFYVDGDDCGGCQFGINFDWIKYTTDGGASYNSPDGDLCSFAVIDSLQGILPWAHQVGPSIGLLVKYREVGTYGADFGDFKLVVMDIVNRNGTPVNGLYYGNFTDWDVGNDLTDGDVAAGYIYNYDEAGVIKGQIGLPLNGSYWLGTLAPTDPMYNARVNHNPTDIYPPADRTPDSLFAWIDDTPEGELRFGPNSSLADPPDDRSYEFACGKVNLAGSGTHSFGFAMFGLPGTKGAIDDLAAFINKYAGFGRGDLNDDGEINLLDLVHLQEYLADPISNPGPIPFMHIGDVNCDGVIDDLDCAYFADFFFYGGPPPVGTFVF